MWHVCGIGEVHVRFRFGNLMVDLGVDGRIMLKWILKDPVGRALGVFL